MSEFSESYHLASTSADDGAALLRAAGLAGWVCPPANGWVTIVPDVDFGMLEPQPLLDASDRLVVHFFNAEDHGWSFAAGSRAGSVGRYEAGWDDDIEVDDSELDLDALVESLTAAGIAVDGRELAAALAEPTEEELINPGANPGHRFAALLGWAEYEWLSGSTARADGGIDGATYIEA